MSVVDTEKKLSAMNAARLVNLAWSELGPMLKDQQTAALAALTQGFRTGRSPDALYPYIAMLVAIEDLEIQAKLKITRGEAAAKEINDGR